MPHIRLPRFTFISGPKETGKSTLAAALAARDSGAVRVSFAEPIRNALHSVFYPGHPLDPPDFREQSVKSSPIPGTNVTHRDWMVSFSSFMKQRHNKHIFGDLAKRTCQQLEEFYVRFIFDDCRYEAELHPFALAYGRDECLLVHLERAGKSWKNEAFDAAGQQDLISYVGARHVALSNNDTVESLIARLTNLLEPSQNVSLARR